MENKLLNSGSDDEDSDTADIATRTRATYFAKKETRPPRPIEPNVQVQNHQEHAGRSGEVSEDKDLGNGGIWSANKYQASSSSYGAYSETRMKTESIGTSSLAFDSEEDVSGWRRETLFWLRHPKIKENWKTVTAAFLLFVAGLAFLIAGIALAATGDDGMKSVIFFVCAAICILPGDRGNDNWLIKYERTPEVDRQVEGEQGGDWDYVDPPKIYVADIDNGLFFPFKHPDSWRTYPFHWAWLTQAKEPFLEEICELILPLLSDMNFVQDLTDDLYLLFREDKGFDKSLFERQMSVLREQPLKHDYKKIDARPTGSHSILLTLIGKFPNILKFVLVGLATDLVK